MTDDDLVEACPNCDSGSFEINTSRGVVNDAPKYRCSTCQHTFDTPDERPPKPGARRTPTRGLAAKLARMGETENP